MINWLLQQAQVTLAGLSELSTGDWVQLASVAVLCLLAARAMGGRPVKVKIKGARRLRSARGSR